MLEAIDIYMTYGSGRAAVDAVRGATLRLRRGTMTFLTGSSGAGKTTLLSILGCLQRPTSGTVRVDGEPAVRLTEMRREKFGFVFQGFNLLSGMSAIENVRIALNIRGWPAGAEDGRAETALRAVGMGHRLRSRVSSLSGGEQQRVALARALVGDPKIILADEPTGNLDSANGWEVMSLLASLAGQGKTVLVVTHEVRYATLADRILTMEDGIVEEESPCRN